MGGRSERRVENGFTKLGVKPGKSQVKNCMAAILSFSSGEAIYCHFWRNDRWGEGLRLASQGGGSHLSVPHL